MAKEQINAFVKAARTATGTSGSLSIPWVGIHVIIEVESISSTPSVVPTIRGLNKRTGNYYDILVGAAITSVGTTVLKIHPSILAVINLSAQDGLPSFIDIEMAHADTDSITYSIDVEGI